MSHHSANSGRSVLPCWQLYAIHFLTFVWSRIGALLALKTNWTGFIVVVIYLICLIFFLYSIFFIFEVRSTEVWLQARWYYAGGIDLCLQHTQHTHNNTTDRQTDWMTDILAYVFKNNFHIWNKTEIIMANLFDYK